MSLDCTSVGGDIDQNGSVVRGRLVEAGSGPLLDRVHGKPSGGGAPDGTDERTRAQHVVDEFAPAAVHPRPALLLGDERRRVLQPLRVSGVGLVKPSGADLGARRSMQDLACRGLWVLGEPGSYMRSDAGGLGGAPVQRVDGVPGPSSSSRGLNRPPGKVSSFDFKWTEMRSTKPTRRVAEPRQPTRPPSAGIARDQQVVGPVGPNQEPDPRWCSVVGP